MNVTVGYPSVKAIDLSVSTSKMMSVIATSQCSSCLGPKFDGGRDTGQYYDIDYKMFTFNQAQMSEISMKCTSKATQIDF